MNRVLIIGFLHPFTRSGGSFRTLPLASHLPEFGWEPVVLTPFLFDKTQLPFQVIETPYQDVLAFWKKLFGFNPDRDVKMQVKDRFTVGSGITLANFFLTRIGEILNYPDSHRGWEPFALEAGINLLEHRQIDAMISCHPTISHIIASKLKAKYKIPWLADFPDLWSQNHNYAYSSLRRAIDRRLELKTLSAADAVSSVSQPWADKLRALHKGKLVYMVTHGFTLEEVNIPPAKLTNKFTITYTGNIYARKHGPDKFFAALRDLILERVIEPNDIEVRFYGEMAGWLEKEIKQYGLSGIVNLYGQVPKDVALQKQRESQLLFITKWKDPKERGAYSGKIFEYLAARRPILATDGSHDVVTDLLNETKAGIDAQSVRDIKDAFQKLYHDYKQRGKIAYNGIDSKINKYSHREMAKKFSEILDYLVPK
ncbi:glycosyltransferase [Chloroflexota bacterium]